MIGLVRSGERIARAAIPEIVGPKKSGRSLASALSNRLSCIMWKIRMFEVEYFNKMAR